jgi:hypothetical protein
MKKNSIFSLGAIALLMVTNIPQAIASQHGARCLNNTTQRVSDCRINIDLNEQTINIRFRSQDETSGNIFLRGNQITELATGRYARIQLERVAKGAVTGGPIGAVINALDSQQRRQFVLTHNKNGNSQLFLIDIPQRFSLLLQQELQAISGLSVQAQPPSR